MIFLLKTMNSPFKAGVVPISHLFFGGRGLARSLLSEPGMEILVLNKKMMLLDGKMMVFDLKMVFLDGVLIGK